jgi:hypothetical protein
MVKRNKKINNEVKKRTNGVFVPPNLDVQGVTLVISFSYSRTCDF